MSPSSRGGFTAGSCTLRSEKSFRADRVAYLVYDRGESQSLLRESKPKKGDKELEEPSQADFETYGGRKEGSDPRRVSRTRNYQGAVVPW